MYNSHVSDQGLKFGKVRTDFDHFYTNFTDQSDTAEIFKVGWDQGFVHVVSGPLQGSNSTRARAMPKVDQGYTSSPHGP